MFVFLWLVHRWSWNLGYLQGKWVLLELNSLPWSSAHPAWILLCRSTCSVWITLHLSYTKSYINIFMSWNVIFWFRKIKDQTQFEDFGASEMCVPAGCLCIQCLKFILKNYKLVLITLLKGLVHVPFFFPFLAGLFKKETYRGDFLLI